MKVIYIFYTFDLVSDSNPFPAMQVWYVFNHLFFTDVDTGSKFYKLLFYFLLLLYVHTQNHFKQIVQTMNYLYSDPYDSEIIQTVFTALKSLNSIQWRISFSGNNS